jgi:Sec-independent protein translocase protein TatA
MSSPLVHAFFVGRALAESLYEQAENSLTEGLSELGKLDAELRERLRNFTEQVIERANQAEETALQTKTTVSVSPNFQPADLQAMIDELRAETAQLKTELKRYRSNTL